MESEMKKTRKRARARSSGKTADRLSIHDWSVCQSGGASAWCCLSFSPSFSLYLSFARCLSFPLASRTPFLDALRPVVRSLPRARFPIGRGPMSKKTSLIRMVEWQSRLPVVRPVHMDRPEQPPPRDNRKSSSSRYRMEERSYRNRFHPCARVFVFSRPWHRAF